MPSLTEQQLDDFLKNGTSIMKLGTITPEGWPYVVPIWYHYDGEAFLLVGRPHRAVWVANIQSNPKVAACIDTVERPYTRVLIEGTAEVADPAWTGDWEPWAIRYLGQEAGHKYFSDTKHMPRTLVRIVQGKITTWAGAGWHPRYVV